MRRCRVTINTSDWTLIASISGILLGAIGGILATVTRMRQTNLQGGSQLIRDALALVKSLQDERETMRHENANLDKQVVELRAQITILETHLRSLQLQIETLTADQVKRDLRRPRHDERNDP